MEEFLKFQNVHQYKKFLSNNQIIRIWGIKSSKLSVFNKTSVNDILLFYHNGNIIGKGKISLKDNNKKLSEELWGFDCRRYTNVIEYWENILFLESFGVINLSFKILIEFASYSDKASVRGFNQYSRFGVEKILQNYQTIEGFLNYYLE